MYSLFSIRHFMKLLFHRYVHKSLRICLHLLLLVSSLLLGALVGRRLAGRDVLAVMLVFGGGGDEEPAHAPAFRHPLAGLEKSLQTRAEAACSKLRPDATLWRPKEPGGPEAGLAARGFREAGALQERR